MGKGDVSARTSRIIYALNRILGLSQERIAAEVGVSYTTVNAWATAKRSPRSRLAEELEAAFRRLTANADRGDDRLRAILAVLHLEYGSPRLGNQDEPLDELFFILLSLKTSHRTYEETYLRFKQEFHPWHKLLEVAPEDVEAHIRRGGLGSIKARAFIDIARCLQRDFGEVSLAALQEMSDKAGQAYLMSLPGVGAKTARCVLMYALGRDVLPVDTHTYRVGLRLGLVPTSISTDHVHAEFDKAVPPRLAYCLHTNFVSLGRQICLDPTPTCDACPVTAWCDYSKAMPVDPEPPPMGRSNLSSSVSSAATRGQKARRPGFTAVDIYAGCGGLSLGLKEAGFEVVYALDWDEHSCTTHRHNFTDTVVDCRDVREVTGKHILSAVGGTVDLVAGGPNCQGVSERGLRNPDDPRNFMFPEFARLVAELKPSAFLMENVPGLAHRHNFGLLQEIFTAFERLGYRCAADVLLAAHYGVPQLRYRFFLIGTVLDLPLSFPAATHHEDGSLVLFGRRFVTVQEAIGDLPPIGVRPQQDVPAQYRMSQPSNDYQEYVREGSDAVLNHICSATEGINLQRISHVPEGGNWKDIPPGLLPPRFFRCRMTDHSTTYARPRRNQPAYTITALFGNVTAGAFSHPTENRALSVREGARLQGFRDRFVFFGPRNSQYRQIGNAVPPLLARAVGEHLLKLLRGHRTAGIRPRITEGVLSGKGAWDALPVLTPRFKQLFGTGTRWPKGWGQEPEDHSMMLDNNYTLRPEFWPPHVRKARRKPMPGSL